MTARARPVATRLQPARAHGRGARAAARVARGAGRGRLLAGARRGLRRVLRRRHRGRVWPSETMCGGQPPPPTLVPMHSPLTRRPPLTRPDPRSPRSRCSYTGSLAARPPFSPSQDQEHTQRQGRVQGRARGIGFSGAGRCGCGARSRRCNGDDAMTRGAAPHATLHKPAMTATCGTPTRAIAEPSPSAAIADARLPRAHKRGHPQLCGAVTACEALRRAQLQHATSSARGSRTSRWSQPPRS